MSEDLIRRSDAIKALDANFTIKGKENMQTVLNYLELVRTRIEGAPSIEPKRGEWKIEVAETIYGKAYLLTCSECGETVSVTENALPYEHFCRNCGARMKGADDERG